MFDHTVDAVAEEEGFVKPYHSDISEFDQPDFRDKASACRGRVVVL